MAQAIVPGIVSNVAANLLEYLGRLAVEKIAPYFGGRSKLNGLKNTMRMIQARLVDAERRGEGEDGEAVIKELLRRLTLVLYRLEDLLEEVDCMTDDNEEEIMEQTTCSARGKQLLQYSCVPFSMWSWPLLINKLVADEAKAIIEELAAIQFDMASLKLNSVHLHGKPLVVPHETKSRQTHSFLDEGKVFGRDDDKRAILKLIFHSDCDVGAENVSVIPIVGIGGLGKTTLARLVYNDVTVQTNFEVKIWACISGISRLEDIVQKILLCIPCENRHQDGLELLQTRLREIIKDKKYLLVLDDIWNEDLDTWLELKSFLCGGKQGSKIIVTSRSKVVAQNMGTVDAYDLDVLPENESWALFRRLAFKEGQEERNPSLTNIGKQIVKKCGNLPLAIRTIAGLLYSKDTQQEWEYFRDTELRMIKPGGNIIMSTLKLSYDHLPSHLKQCFAYCSLFPKGYEYEKQRLIELWMAQGILGSSNRNQIPEDVGHMSFMELLHISFFQEVKRSDYDDTIISCKMHDLVHDLALDVARGETPLIDGPTQHINDDVLHLSILGDLFWEVPWSLLAGKKLLRSLIVVERSWHTPLNLKMVMHEALANLRHLRALELGGVHCESLPNSIGELKHLRYLGLGELSLESLPKAITRLRYLQTLDLRGCRKLRQLPSSLGNLNRLRSLYIPQGKLMDLPPRFGQLTSLRELNEFVVGEHNGFDALASLKNLAGCLKIRFVKRRGNVAFGTEIGILKETTNLTELQLASDGDLDDEGANLECLQPPPTLKKLVVKKWNGTTFPNWGMDDELLFFPSLVSIQIKHCSRCEKLPPFSRLPCLRNLWLEDLPSLEYVENEVASSPYFPSLESLELHDLPKLKGWSRMEGGQDDDANTTPLFPRLLALEIQRCPELMWMPLVPKLVRLKTYEVHWKVVKHLLCGDDDQQHLLCDTTLTHLIMGKVHGLLFLSLVHLSSLQSLEIYDCKELIDFRLEFPKSLQKLEIEGCGSLRDISGALQHASALEYLTICRCKKVELGVVVVVVISSSIHLARADQPP